MKRPGYREAIEWIARNDDCYWLGDDEPIMSVSVAMVRDLWNVPDARVVRNLRTALRKICPDHEALHKTENVK